MCENNEDAFLTNETFSNTHITLPESLLLNLQSTFSKSPCYIMQGLETDFSYSTPFTFI